MQYTSKKEIFLSLALTILVVILINPFHLLMPTMMHMLVLGLFVVFTGLFAGLVVHEKVTDEREDAHRAQAGRMGYTLGLIVLTLGILIQTLRDVPVDVWLLLALLVMVLGKIGFRMFLRKYK